MLKTANETTVNQNHRTHRYGEVFFGLLAFLIVSFAVIIIRSVSDPLTRLQKGTEIIARGNLDYKTDIRTSDEIGHLSASFDVMAEHLKIITVSRNDLNREIEERKLVEAALLDERRRLQKALDEVRTLRGIVPICSNCKKIRDDQGYWNQVEQYISDHSEAQFSHGICPECVKKLYPDLVIGPD